MPRRLSMGRKLRRELKELRAGQELELELDELKS